MYATINIVLDTRRIKKSKKYPVKLRVTFERVTEYYQTYIDLSKDDFNKLTASRINKDLQTIRDKISTIEGTAKTAVSEITEFNFEEFEKSFIQNNHFFHQRKSKSQIICDTVDSFDYTPFHKKFPILLEVILILRAILLHIYRTSKCF